VVANKQSLEVGNIGDRLAARADDHVLLPYARSVGRATVDDFEHLDRARTGIEPVTFGLQNRQARQQEPCFRDLVSVGVSFSDRELRNRGP
jgi:hypothetical protein